MRPTTNPQVVTIEPGDKGADHIVLEVVRRGA